MVMYTGNIEQTLERYHNPIIKSKYLLPEECHSVYHAIKTLKLPYDDQIKILIANTQSFDSVILKLVKESMKRGLTDYDGIWFQWFKRKIIEFHFRYTRQKFRFSETGIVNNKTYKTLFLLYMKLYHTTSIYEQEETGKELDYFIAAQYSVRYDKNQGLLSPVTLKTFAFTDNIDNYLRFKSSNLSPSLVGDRHRYLSMGELAHDKAAKQSIYLLDHESLVYRDFVVPILKMRIPILANKTVKNLATYLKSIELAIFRELGKARHHNIFILSIEHLRTYTALYKKLKQGEKN
jgi:hypothetical protein